VPTSDHRERTERRYKRRADTLSLHVSASKHQGGERDERGGVGEEDERGLRSVYLWRREAGGGLCGEGVGEGGRVLAGEEPAGVCEGFASYRQVEDDGLYDQGVDEADADGERGAPEERGKERAERGPDRQDQEACAYRADELARGRSLQRCARERGYDEATGRAGGEREDDEQGQYDAEGEQLAAEERGSARSLGEDGFERGSAVLASHGERAQDQGYRGSHAGVAGDQVPDQALWVEGPELLLLELLLLLL
jgi:hypothetical protein